MSFRPMTSEERAAHNVAWDLAKRGDFRTYVQLCTNRAGASRWEALDQLQDTYETYARKARTGGGL